MYVRKGHEKYLKEKQASDLLWLSDVRRVELKEKFSKCYRMHIHLAEVFVTPQGEYCNCT